VLGDVVGACIAYAIGYFGRIELIERHGNKLHVSRARLDRAHAWFERFGAPVMFFTRMMPVIRAAFPYAAGVAKMPFWKMLLFTTLGSIVWITGLAFLGRAVGSSWQSWRHHLDIVDYVALALLVAAIAYLIVRNYRRGGGEPAADGVSE
jgi:membrane protein DedA with SNARE-associated domain